MLQEATKILNSAFHNSFIKRLSLYLHDCVREEVKSSTFRNLKQDKENQWIFLAGEERLFNNFSEPLILDGADANITKLMALSDMSQKDKYLIYGYLFLVGKNKRSSEFLTPLLYAPCKLERDGMNIICNLQDEVLSVNTGALITLMQKTDDDEMEHLLSSLVDAVPDLPLTQEKIDIFLTTLRAIIPDLKVNINHEDDETEINIDNKAEEFYSSNKNNEDVYEPTDDIIDEMEKTKPVNKVDNVSVTGQSALILTSRPQVTAGVLHELIQIAEKPSGIFRETALSLINEEYLQGSGKLVEQQQVKKLKDFIPVTPLSLSDSQESVLKKIEENQLIAVYGPPGTGKSQTIVNLVAHLIANGKTVLVASRMDKAVDVVSERLNELGAPYLALRAGRPNYQKQLKFDLEDLIAEKVDLNSGYEKSMLVDIKDMQVLLSTKKELEDKCEQIINLENQYHDVFLEKEAESKIALNSNFITSTLKKDEIDLIQSLIDKIEQNYEKSDFFSGWSVNNAISKLKKILNIQKFSADVEDIENLKAELRIQDLNCQCRLIEAQIHKIGNIHSLLEQIRLLKKKQRNLAIEILKHKRRNSLKDLLHDPVKRKRLIVHSKALVEKKKNMQNRLLEDEDFKPLLDAFPCWCVTTYAISGSVPMKPGLFDVAIIDEASQCDIASCFPILYRAKRAVIVGDDKQLPHLSFLEKAKEQSFLTQYEIPDKYQLMWRFRTNSMFDLANYYSMSPVLLDEHFRSSKPIIDFSNKEFYGNRIRIMNKSTDFKGVLEVNYVYDGKVDFAVTRNMPEAEAVVQRVHELITDNEHDDPDNPQSIGIISPFRGQVELIKHSLMQVLSDTVIKKYKIEVGTAHTFQGDERDIMILSWAIAQNSHSQSLTFLQRPNLFNVAITRARKKLICFISKDPKTLQEGLLRSYMEYMLDYSEGSKIQEKLNTDYYKNDFEKEVAAALRENGVEVRAGVEVAGFSTDLLINNPGGEQIILEIDGVEDNIKCPQTNIKKQAILERSGFKVVRLSFREWQNSKPASIDRIMSNL